MRRVIRGAKRDYCIWRSRGISPPIHLLTGLYKCYPSAIKTAVNQTIPEMLINKTIKKRSEYDHKELDSDTIWRLTEVERQYLIMKMIQNPKDERMISYTKTIYNRDNLKFLLNTDKLISNLVDKNNIIRIPKHITDGLNFARFLKNEIINRNKMNKENFLSLPFFQTYHLQSNRFPASNFQNEIISEFFTLINCKVEEQYHITNYHFVPHFGYNKIYLRELYTIGIPYTSNNMWTSYIKDYNCQNKLKNQWYKNKANLPVWYNHILVIDE